MSMNKKSGTGKGIVIGGGASGLTAAIAAAENGADVTLIEHTGKLGKKLLNTGNGRCNMTNLALSAECYRSDDPDFPMKVIENFTVSDTLDFFRTLGIVTTERWGYVYPASGEARTVLEALYNRITSLDVTVIMPSEPKEIKVRDSDPQRFHVITDQCDVSGDFLIIAAGSCAAPSTGSDGSGYKLAESLGHTVNRPLPALTALKCEGSFFNGIAGVRTDANVSVYSDKRGFLASDRGELQLNEHGISGIPVFQVSRFASEAIDKGESVNASIDFAPSYSENALRDILKEQREYLSSESAPVFLNGIFNRKLASLFLKRANISSKIKISSVTDKNINDLVKTIKKFTVKVISPNPFEQAQVCMGGVSTHEIDPETMGSKIIPGLYFAGEIVDVDGICGGYNLQWAWSSGYTAGRAAASGNEKNRAKIS